MPGEPETPTGRGLPRNLYVGSVLHRRPGVRRHPLQEDTRVRSKQPWIFDFRVLLISGLLISCVSCSIERLPSCSLVNAVANPELPRDGNLPRSLNGEAFFTEGQEFRRKSSTGGHEVRSKQSGSLISVLSFRVS